MSRSVRLIVQGWLGSRLILASVGVIVAITTGRSFGQIVSSWDAGEFMAIAVHGYDTPNSVAFFPGLPMLLRLGSLLGLPMPALGVALSVLGSAAAATALYRLGGVVATLAWLIAPTTVFTIVPYAESLFCAAAFWAWERARHGKWWQAALLAGIACALRISGLFLVAALFVLVLTQPSPQRRYRNALWLTVPGTVLLGYELFLWARTGDPLAWFRAQDSGWNRSFTWPWDCLVHSIQSVLPGAYADHPGWVWVFRGEMISMLVGLGVTVWCLRKRRFAQATWVGLQVLAFSLSYWFMSVNRAVLLWFPLWILIGEWAQKFSEWLDERDARGLVMPGGVSLPRRAVVDHSAPITPEPG